MKARLTPVFALVLVAILAATGWASSQAPIWAVPPEVAQHPWFIATMVDTYLAFFVIWLWIAYLERSVVLKIVWLVLIFATGNMAIAVYVLLRLWRLPKGATVEDLLLRR